MFWSVKEAIEPNGSKGKFEAIISNVLQLPL